MSTAMEQVTAQQFQYIWCKIKLFYSRQTRDSPKHDTDLWILEDQKRLAFLPSISVEKAMILEN